MTGMRRGWIQLVAAVFIAGIGVGVGLSVTNSGDESSVVLETNPAASGPEPIVFYSGDHEAGIASADEYSAWEFAEDNQWGGFHWSDWNGDDPGTCDPSFADDFPSDRGLHVLVGYSSGRLGPVYFLRSAESRYGEIDTIYLLDPGNRIDFSGCDSRTEHRASYYLERWLRGGDNRRLIIVSAERTNMDGRRALEDFYLAPLHASASVAERTFVCVDTSTSHDQTDDVYMPRIAANSGRLCPAGTYRERLTVRTTPTQATAPGTVPTVPPSTPAPTTPSAPLPPATSAPTTPPATPSPTTTGSGWNSPPTTPPPPTTAAPSPTPTTRRNGTVNGCNTYGQNCDGNPIFRGPPPQTNSQYQSATRITAVNNGVTLTARCWATGTVVWNYAVSYNPPDYGPNPYESTIYFSVQAPNGEWGFIPDTYFVRDKNGQLGLAAC